MDNEKLKLAISLSEDIRIVKVNISNWESAERFADQVTVYSSRNKEYITTDLLDFEFIKQYTLIKLKAKLFELETKFNEL